MTIDVKGTIGLTVDPAVQAVNKLVKALKTVDTAGEGVTASQKRALDAVNSAAQGMVAAHSKAQAAIAQTTREAIESDRKLRNLDLNAKTARSNSVAQSDAKVNATQDVAAGTVINNASITAARVAAIQLAAANNEVTASFRQEAIAAESAGRVATESAKQQLLASKLVGQELRNQAAAQAMVTNAAHSQSAALGQVRYALYDVSRTALIAGTALTAAFVAPVAVAIQMERQFANVQRTVGGTGPEVQALREDFLGLAAAIPESFEDLTKIGTLAGQIGIARESVVGFTATVAQFSTTTGVSVDESATAFGRLNSLLTGPNGVNNNFTGLADSVLNVGVNSVATEQQILKISTQISSLTNAAGFGYEATVGLSGALASIAVPPELARGVITRVFGTISRSIGEGGANLERFGKLAGLSGAEFKEAWNSDAAGTFQRVMDGIRENGGNAEQAIRDLGITSVRDVPILLRLANAADAAGVKGGLLAQTMRDAASENASGQLATQYGIVADTIAAKIQVLVNNVQLLANAAGSGGLGPLGAILDFFVTKLQQLSSFLTTGFGQVIAGIGFAIVGLGAALALATAVASKGVTSYLALIAALTGVAEAGGLSALAMTGLTGALTAAGVSARVATPLVAGLGIAMSALTAIGVGLALAAVADGISTAALEANGAKISVGDLADELANLSDTSAVLDALGRRGNVFARWDNTPIKDTSAALQDLAKHAAGIDRDFTAGLDVNATNTNNNLKTFAASLDVLISDGKLEEASHRIAEFQRNFNLSDAEAASLLGDAYDKVGDGAKKAAEGFAELTPEEEAATQATQDFLDVIAGGDASFVNINEAYQSQIEGAQKSAQKQADATDDMSDSWQTYFDGFSVNIDAYLAELERMTGAQANWEKNLTTLRLGGLSDDALAELTKLGVEGAPLVQAFTDDFAANGRSAIDRFNASLEEGSTGATVAFATMLNKLSPAVQGAFGGLGSDAINEIATKLQEGGYTFAGIVAEYNLDVPASVVAEVDGVSVEQAQAVLDNVANLRDAGILPTVLPDPYNISVEQLNGAANPNGRPRTADIFAIAQPDAAILSLEEVANRKRNAIIQAIADNIQPVADVLDELARDRYANVIASFGGQTGSFPGVLAPTGKTGGQFSDGLPHYALGGRHVGAGRVYGPGNGTSDDVNAKIAHGEWVIRAAAAAKLGPAFMNMVNHADTMGSSSGVVQGASYGRSSRSSGSSFPTSIMAELSPTDRQWLARIASAVGITIAPSDLAAATNASNLSSFQKGSN